MDNKVMRKIVAASNGVVQINSLDTVIARAIVACQELEKHLQSLDNKQDDLLKHYEKWDVCQTYQDVVWKYAYLCAAMRVLFTWIDDNGIYANYDIDDNAAGVDTARMLNVLKFWYMEDDDD